MLREFLRDGSFRLAAGETSFVIRRLRPGVVLVLANGTDHGQLAAAVTEELSAELERFPIKTELFICAFDVDNVHPHARLSWTEWMERHREQISGVRVLTRTANMQLILKIAGHDSRMDLRAHTDPDKFLVALRQAARAPHLPDPREHGKIEAAEVRVEVRPLSTKLSDGHCTYEFRSFPPTVLLMRVVGDDAGILASRVFDELKARQEGFQALHLYLDLCQAKQPTIALSELWTEWFAANKQRLASVAILSTDQRVSLTTNVAAWRSQTGSLISHMSNPEAFSASLSRRASNNAIAY